MPIQPPPAEAFPVGVTFWSAFCATSGVAISKFIDYLLAARGRKPEDAAKFQDRLMLRLAKCEEDNERLQTDLDSIRVKYYDLHAHNAECEKRSDEMGVELAETRKTVTTLQGQVKKLQNDLNGARHHKRRTDP